MNKALGLKKEDHSDNNFNKLLLRCDYLKRQKVVAHVYFCLRALNNGENNEKVKYAYAIFSRIYSCSKIIKNIIESNDLLSWDRQIISIMARCIMEASEMLFFICLENISDKEKAMRIISLNLNFLKDNFTGYEKLEKALIQQNATPEKIKKVQSHKNKCERLMYLQQQNAKSNPYLEMVGKRKDKVLRGQCRYFHLKYPSEEMRDWIEKQMNVLPNFHKLAYQEFSSMVHPYSIVGSVNYGGSPAYYKEVDDINLMSVIEDCTSYLIYSARETIDKILFAELKDSLGSKLENLRKIRKTIDEPRLKVKYVITQIKI